MKSHKAIEDVLYFLQLQTPHDMYNKYHMSQFEIKVILVYI